MKLTESERRLFLEARKNILGWRPPKQVGATARKLYEPPEPGGSCAARMGKSSDEDPRPRGREERHEMGRRGPR